MKLKGQIFLGAMLLIFGVMLLIPRERVFADGYPGPNYEQMGPYPFARFPCDQILFKDKLCTKPVPCVQTGATPAARECPHAKQYLVTTSVFTASSGDGYYVLDVYFYPEKGLKIVPGTVRVTNGGVSGSAQTSGTSSIDCSLIPPGLAHPGWLLVHLRASSGSVKGGCAALMEWAE